MYCSDYLLQSLLFQSKLEQEQGCNMVLFITIPVTSKEYAVEEANRVAHMVRNGKKSGETKTGYIWFTEEKNTKRKHEPKEISSGVFSTK